VAPGQQGHDAAGHIRQVGPLVAHACPAGLAHLGDRPTRLHQALGEPAVAAARAEEVAGPHDQHPPAGGREVLQPLLHRHPDGAFARERVLGGGFAQQRTGIGAVVVERAGQHDQRLLGPGRGQRVLQHGQHPVGPVPVARRVHGVHDHPAALGGGHHVGGVQGVAPHPGQAGLGRRLATAQGPHRPAGIAQLPGHFAANAAGGAQHQCGVFVFHGVFLERVWTGGDSGQRVSETELAIFVHQLYIHA
jgi:hypothetical protein